MANKELKKQVEKLGNAVDSLLERVVSLEQRISAIDEELGLQLTEIQSDIEALLEANDISDEAREVLVKILNAVEKAEEILQSLPDSPKSE